MLDVALIGFGALAREVVRRLDGRGEARVVAVVVRPGRAGAARAVLPDGLAVVDSVDRIPGTARLVAECAGHGAVAQYGPEILGRGVDFLAISIGALADRALAVRLEAAAAATGAKLVLPPGALAGADALAAARVGGLDRVTYVSRKPPGAWLGTPAEAAFDLPALEAETVLFEGPADEAARLYPQNANVAAAVALAGAGFEATRVRLLADPAAGGNVHSLRAEGAFGAFEVEIRGRPLPGNPKTSTLAAHSVVAEILRRAVPVEV